MCSHCKEGADRTEECSSEPKNIPAASRICLLFIKGYQYCISPLFPPCCRYTPTCSQYAVEAVSRYGAIKGVWFSLCRILRCHPFARGGYDPVK